MSGLIFSNKDTRHVKKEILSVFPSK